MAKLIINPITGELDATLNKAKEIKYDNVSSGLTATDVQAAVDEVSTSVSTLNTKVGNLQTLSGVASNATNLGTFTGNIIPDSSNNKQALQSLESAIEGLPTPIVYKGTWSAATNTPTLLNTDTGKTGYLYQVNVAGTVNFGAGPISFDVGDKVVNDGTAWQKWDMTDAVTSVNGQTGTVVLTSSDITEGTNLYFTDERAQDAVGNILVDSGRIDFTYNDAGNTITADLITGSVSDTYLGTGINALKIGTGNVDNTEFSYLDNVTSPIQTQLNGKQATGNYITNLTTDVVATGPGAAAATIQAGVVTNSKLANMATQTIKGRTTAGTGSPEDLTATQATAILSNFVGDSGAGGTKGLVPAPAAGDAAALKYLKADGTWAAVPSGGDVSSNTATSVDSEVALFNGTTGKSIKRATGTGVAHLTSGVLSASNVMLTTEVTEILPVANGGTGSSSLTANNVLLGNGTSALQVVAPGTSGNVLSSNGTTWTSAAPATPSLAVTSKTTTYTITNADDVIKCSTAGGAFTITLPTAVGITGKSFRIIKTDATINRLIITTTSSQTFNTITADLYMITLGDFVTVLSDGSNWVITEDGINVCLVVTGQPQTSYTASTAIIFPTVQKDTRGAYNNANGQFSVAFPGWYYVQYFVNTNSGNAYLDVYVAGSIVAPGAGTVLGTLGYGGGSTMVYAGAGDIITVRSDASWSNTFSGHNGLTIHRIK